MCIRDRNNVVRMLCKGMLVYSGGCALGEPLTHLGAIALGGHVEEQKEQFVTLGERVAAQAASCLLYTSRCV